MFPLEGVRVDHMPKHSRRAKKAGYRNNRKKPSELDAIAKRTKRGGRNSIRMMLRIALSNPDTEIYAGRPSAFDTFSRHRLTKA